MSSRGTSAPLTVAVVGRKGGAGKTTTAFNLAGALAVPRRRVLLVDMDRKRPSLASSSVNAVTVGLGQRFWIHVPF